MLSFPVVHCLLKFLPTLVLIVNSLKYTDVLTDAVKLFGFICSVLVGSTGEKKLGYNGGEKAGGSPHPTF